jgi:hypothetical protein
VRAVRVPVALLLLSSLAALAQESRPDSASASRPAKRYDRFKPADADSSAMKALVGLAKGKIAIDWIDQEKPKPALRKGLTEGGLDESITAVARMRVAKVAFDDGIAARDGVVANGLAAKGARVLPLGRFEWEKPQHFVKEGDSAKTPVLCVVVASEPRDPGVKGFWVKGEFLDESGKRIADFDRKSGPSSSKRGVYVLVAPAGNALKNAGEVEGFEFRLVDVKPLK